MEQVLPTGIGRGSCAWSTSSQIPGHFLNSILGNPFFSTFSDLALSKKKSVCILDVVPPRKTTEFLRVAGNASSSASKITVGNPKVQRARGKDSGNGSRIPAALPRCPRIALELIECIIRIYALFHNEPPELMGFWGLEIKLGNPSMKIDGHTLDRKHNSNP